VWGRLLHRTVTINARDFPLRLARDYGYPPERIAVVYNGIDTEVPSIDATARADARDAFELRADALIVGYVGRLSPEKGVHVLLDALARAPERVCAVIVGDGPQRAELEVQTERLALGDRVRFLGHRSEIRTIFASLDVVAVPSLWYEAFGRVVVEAMNEGVPVVAARIGGMAELFTDGVEGFFVESGSVESLASCLATLPDQRERLADMGARGRALVRERYSLARVLRDYEAEYARLLGESR
jgi:glycosyltransferase involved in cell wall biosynthesis